MSQLTPVRFHLFSIQLNTLQMFVFVFLFILEQIDFIQTVLVISVDLDIDKLNRRKLSKIHKDEFLIKSNLLKVHN